MSGVSDQSLTLIVPAQFHRQLIVPSDEDYRELQLHLAQDPEAGDVIQGTGGFRKMRWVDRRRGQAVPLEWFPRLRDATPEERHSWELIGRGVGIRWPALDEDISVAGLLGFPD
jgi:hypothetical protein